MDTIYKKILIIDDDEVMLKSLKNSLINSQFEVITTKDGDAGLVSALNQEPDLIITDLEMNKVDGISVIKEIREYNNWGKNVPIVVLTNHEITDLIKNTIIPYNVSIYIEKSKVSLKNIVDEIIKILNK